MRLKQGCLGPYQENAPRHSVRGIKLLVGCALIGAMSVVSPGCSGGTAEPQPQDRVQQQFDYVRSGESNGAAVVDLDLIPKLAGDPTCVANLKGLTFGKECDLADERLRDVGKLTSLRGIVFHNAKNADALLVHLAGHPALEVVTFDGAPVTATGLRNLANCPKLRSVELGTAPVAAAEFEQIKQALPNAKVTPPWNMGQEKTPAPASSSN